MSRRTQIRMTQDEVREYLRASKTLILTSVGPNGYPHPMPMWFAMDDACVICMTTFRRSQKVLNLKRDPKVSLLAESGVEYPELKGVVLYGKAEIVDDLDTVVDTLMRAAGNEVPEDDEQARKAMAEVMQKTASKRVCIRVSPDRIVSWDHAKLGGVY